jgi:hypothetical protein
MVAAAPAGQRKRQVLWRRPQPMRRRPQQQRPPSRLKPMPQRGLQRRHPRHGPPLYRLPLPPTCAAPRPTREVQLLRWRHDQLTAQQLLQLLQDTLQILATSPVQKRRSSGWPPAAPRSRRLPAITRLRRTLTPRRPRSGACLAKYRSSPTHCSARERCLVALGTPGADGPLREARELFTTMGYAGGGADLLTTASCRTRPECPPGRRRSLLPAAAARRPARLARGRRAPRPPRWRCTLRPVSGPGGPRG